MSSAPVTSPSSPLSDRLVRRGLRFNILAGSIGMLWVVALNMPYTMLLDELGANGVLQGLSSTIIQLTLAIQIPGAFFLESLRRRKVAWGVIAIIHRLIWFIPAYVAWLHPAPPIGAHVVVMVAALSMALGNFAASAWHSWLADLVPEATRGRFWSSRQAWTMSAFLVGMACTGRILDRVKPVDPGGPLTGFALIFGVAAIFGAIDIAIHLLVPEPPVKRTPQDVSLADRLIAPFQHPNFLRLGIAMGLWMFSCTLVGAFGQLYARRVFHATYTELSAWSITASIGTIVAGLAVGHLIDRVGARAFGACMILLAPCFGAAWFLFTDTPLEFHLPLFGAVHTSWGMALITVICFFSAGFYSSVGLAHMSLLASTAPERGRTLAMAVQWTLIGLIGAGGPIVGGYVMDLFPKEGLQMTLLHGTRFHFVHALVILHALTAWFVVLPVFLSIRAKRESIGMLEAFDRIVLVNPLRFASGIYHARVMTSPVTRRRRAQAVEATGESGAEVFVADLAARLSDASADVREAAAQSLGRIGTSDAIEALVRALQDPASDLAVHVLRALRRCADHRATAAVLARLADENQEVVREAARTLGAIGDVTAVPPLLDLLHRTRHEGIAMAAADALGRLDDLTAVYEILPRMRTTASATARRAYAVATADLLGDPDGFYRILSQEEQSHGSGMAPVFARLRSDVARLDTAAGAAAPVRSQQLLASLDRQYEARDIRAAAATAFELALELVTLRYGLRHGADTRLFLRDLQAQDARFGVGAWYLAVLHGAFDRPSGSASLGPAREMVEIQLAVYILASWAGDQARRGAGHS
jgi:HEAT repeat protein/MFS family permease